MRYLFFVLLIVCSCESNVGSRGIEKLLPAVRKSTKFRNGIAVQTSGGVSVEQAYLTYEDESMLVDDSNTTALNEPLKLHLYVKGWKARN